MSLRQKFFLDNIIWFLLTNVFAAEKNLEMRTKEINVQTFVNLEKSMICNLDKYDLQFGQI